MRYSILKILSMLLLLLVFYSSPAKGQETIFIAGANLYLGMPEEVVFEKIDKKLYSLKAISDKTGSFVIVKNTDDDTNILGTLSFRNDKLSFLSKQWHHASDYNSYTLGEILFYLLSQEIGEQGESSVQIKTVSSRDIDYELKVIELNLGQKTISITVTKGEKEKIGNQISVFESLK